MPEEEEVKLVGQPNFIMSRMRRKDSKQGNPEYFMLTKSETSSNPESKSPKSPALPGASAGKREKRLHDG